MPVRYSQYLNAAAVRHRSLSYNVLAPIVDGSGQKPGRISLSFNQAIELLAPYCGLRVIDQLKAVAPLCNISSRCGDSLVKSIEGVLSFKELNIFSCEG